MEADVFQGLKQDMKKELTIFVIIPLLINGLFLGLYFSGVGGLQQVVAPTINWLPQNSWREFGLLEQLQNLLLLAVLTILVLGAFRKTGVLDKGIMVAGSIVFLFLFLEEIDYGINFYEYLTGGDSGIRLRNWHNQESDGQQNISRFKQIMDGMMCYRAGLGVLRGP